MSIYYRNRNIVSNRLAGLSALSGAMAANSADNSAVRRWKVAATGCQVRRCGPLPTVASDTTCGDM